MLKEKDMSKIKEYILSAAENVSSFGLGMDRFIGNWEKAKEEKLFKLFNGEVILEKEISFDKSDDTLMEELCYSSGISNTKFYSAFKEVCSANKNLYEISNLVSMRALAKNEVLEDLTLEIKEETTVKSPSTWFSEGRFFNLKPCKIKIQKGSKIIKILRKLITPLGLGEFEEDFSEFINIQSRVLNGKKTKGILCLSIHPLDYITMSHNTHCWSSCMSWVSGDGCYQAGTLEMMNCPNTIVAYLKSVNDINETSLHGNVDWNSKKWRTLVHLNEDVVIVNKNYPCNNDDLNKAVATWVRELAVDNLGYDYDEYFYEGGLAYLFCLMSYKHMYNDFGNGASEAGFLSKKLIEGHKIPKNASQLSDFHSNEVGTLIFGGETYCLECGGCLDTEEQLVCFCCYEGEGNDECEHCGDYGYSDDFTWVRDEHMQEILVCDCCMENYRFCDSCDEYLHYSLFDSDKDVCQNCDCDEED